MLTFYDCQTDRGITTAAHVDPASQDFADRLNEASRRLMDYGDWWSTVDKLVLASYNHTIVWPNYVGTPLALSDHHGGIRLQNGWHDFLPLEANDWRHIGYHYPHKRNLDCGWATTELGTSPVAINIPNGMANYLYAQARSPLDAGKTITFWGADVNGQPVSETLAVSNMGFTVSTNQFRHIDRVVKDASSDFFDVYQCSEATPGTLLDVAHYGPGETRPEYRVTRINRHRDTGNPHFYSALVKLQHVDAVAGSDLVLPGNRAALKLMLLSVHKEEASDPKGAETESMRAIHELNRELNNRLPEFQIPISYEELGGADMRLHSAF